MELQVSVHFIKNSDELILIGLVNTTMLPQSQTLTGQNSVYVKESQTTGMEWMATHALQIVICKIFSDQDRKTNLHLIINYNIVLVFVIGRINNKSFNNFNINIFIVLDILTCSFDLYVKKRQLNKFNETEIPKIYDSIKSRNNGEDIVS